MRAPENPEYEPPWLQTIRAKAIREHAYRRALKAAGYMPKSIEIMLDRDREYLDWPPDRGKA